MKDQNSIMEKQTVLNMHGLFGEKDIKNDLFFWRYYNARRTKPKDICIINVILMYYDYHNIKKIW